MCLKNTFPRSSDAKIKEGVFVGPQTGELINDIKSEDQLSEVEKAARNLIKDIATILRGNHKAETYRDMLADLVQSYS